MSLAVLNFTLLVYAIRIRSQAKENWQRFRQSSFLIDDAADRLRIMSRFAHPI